MGVPFGDAAPGVAVAVQTFGDFLNFNPHLDKANSYYNLFIAFPGRSWFN